MQHEEHLSNQLERLASLIKEARSLGSQTIVQYLEEQQRALSLAAADSHYFDDVIWPFPAQTGSSTKFTHKQ